MKGQLPGKTSMRKRKKKKTWKLVS